MVKFIVEVDEEYIRKNANFSLMLKQAKNMEGTDTLSKLADTISFSILEKKIKSGEKEFVITRDKIDEKAHIIYDNAASLIAALSGVFLKEEKAEEKETEG